MAVNCVNIMFVDRLMALETQHEVACQQIEQQKQRADKRTADVLDSLLLTLRTPPMKDSQMKRSRFEPCGEFPAKSWRIS